MKKIRSDSIRRITAMMIKESHQIMRDPSTLLISVFLPLLLLFLYGYGVSLDLNHLRLGLVMEDTSPDVQTFVESFTNSRYFETKIVHDRREVIEDLMKGAIRGYVVVPSYFTEFKDRPNGAIAPIQVIADGSEPNTASFVLNYVQGAFQQWLIQERLNKEIKPPVQVQVDPRYWYNEQLESRYFLLSGSLAIIMTLIGTLLTALVVSREWERGTMEGLISTTITKGELIIGKVLPYFILGMISMTICALISVFFYGLPLRGSFLLLGLVSATFLFCALGIGLMISTFFKKQIVASQVATIVGFLPAYILSGFLFEINSMPLPIKLLTYIIPARYFVQSLQTIFLVGNVWSLILLNMLFLIVIGFLFFFITIKKTVKRLD